MEDLVLIYPKEGADNHIESHIAINRALVILNQEIIDLKKELELVKEKQSSIDKLSGRLQIQYTNAVQALRAEFTPNK